ncbi:unnamed protein product [Haemonchus placei]|uniref:Secreted protein n=1 Tax=Haemonchus placei TaxID=6290 RepID=A0A0N4X0D0_HAEPC|nr:unnamed protein product [Haemonchus placei]
MQCFVVLAQFLRLIIFSNCHPVDQSSKDTSHFSARPMAMSSREKTCDFDPLMGLGPPYLLGHLQLRELQALIAYGMEIGPDLTKFSLALGSRTAARAVCAQSIRELLFF